MLLVLEVPRALDARVDRIDVTLENFRYPRPFLRS